MIHEGRSIFKSLEDARMRFALAVFVVVSIFAALTFTVFTLATNETITQRLRIEAWTTSAEIDTMLDALQRAKSDVQGAVKNLQAMQATVERVISPNNGALLDVIRSDQKTRKLLATADWQVSMLAGVSGTIAAFRRSIIRKDLSFQDVAAVFAPSLDYGISVAFNLGIPIAVGFLCSAIGFFVWLCRCCKCCGSRVPRKGGYTTCELWFPVIFLFAVGGALTWAIMLAFAGDEQMHSGFEYLIDTPTNLGNILQGKIDEVSDVMVAFGAALVRQVGEMKKVLSNVDTIPPAFATMTAEVNSITSSFTVRISTPFSGITDNITAIQNILTQLGDYGVSVPSVPTLPDSTTDLISSLNNSMQAASSQLSSMGGTVNSTISNLQQLVDSSVDNFMSKIEETLNSTAAQVQGFGGNIDSIVSTASQYTGMARPYLSYRMIGTYVVLGIVAFLFFLGMLGGLLQMVAKKFAQFLSCCLGFWSCAMWWWIGLLFGVYFGLAIASNDACTTYLPTIWTQFDMPSFVPAVVNCSDGNVFVTLGYASYFNVTQLLDQIASGLNFNTFTSQLDPATYVKEFSSLGTIDVQSFLGTMNISTLVNQVSNIRTNLTVDQLGSSRGLNTTTALKALDDIHDAIGIVYTFDNITLLDPDAYTGSVKARLEADKAIVTGYNHLAELVPQLQANLTSIEDKLNAIPVAINNIQSSVDSLAPAVNASLNSLAAQVRTVIGNLTLLPNALLPLQGDMTRLYNLGNCTFVADLYSGITGAFCTSIAGGLDGLWFALFVIFILLLPGCVIGTIGGTRYGEKMDTPSSSTPVLPLANKGDIPMAELHLENTPYVEPLPYQPQPAPASDPHAPPPYSDPQMFVNPLKQDPEYYT